MSYPILIVDDHPLFASALLDLISSLESDAEVQVCNGFSPAMDFVAAQSGLRLVFLDLDLPDSPPSQSLLQIRQAFAGVPVVVVSALDDPKRQRQALAAGAVSFLSKGLRPREMVEAIRQALLGQSVAPPERDEASGDSPLNLSPRQQQVLEAIQTGLSNKEVARALDMTEGTVKVHLRDIYRRLEVGSRTEAVAMYTAALQAHHA